jgi:hypothetical protein
MKILHVARRRLSVHVDRFDACATWSAPEFMLEPIERFAFPLSAHFNTSVRQISHPPAQAFDARGAFDKEPESDALHASAHEKPA